MLYFYMRNVKNGDTEETVPVLLCTEKAEIVTDFLFNSALFQKVRAVMPEASFAWSVDSEVPMIILRGSALDQSQVQNVSNVFNFSQNILAKYGSLNADIQEKMVLKVKTKYEESLAKLLVAASSAILGLSAEAFQLPFNIGVDLIDQNLRTITMQKIAAYNASFKKVFKSISDLDNITLTQNKEDDPLFVEIPDRTVLLEDNLKWSTIIPKRAQVYTAYSEKAAYTKYYRDKVSKHLIPLIEGRKENNGLPIQENEQKYYNALCEWVTFNISEEFGDDSDVIDNVSREYLTELCNHAYAWGWAHNDNVPVDFVDDSDDDENDSETATTKVDGAQSRFVFERDINDDRPLRNALIDLKHFVENASVEVGWKAYVEAVVKLLRWGQRKPTMLKIDGYSKVFELATNTERQDLGSIEDYQTKPVNGRMYSLVGWITPSLNAMDPNLKEKNFRAVPIGIALKNVLVNKENGTLEVPTYYSLFDAVPLIKSGELTIDGIESDLTMTVTPKIYSVDVLLNDYKNHQDEFIRNPLWRSKELKELCLEFSSGRSGDEQNLLVIFDEVMKNSNFTQEAKQFAVSSIEELKRKVASFEIYSGSAALITNVGSLMLPVMESVLASEKEILPAWDEALTKWEGVRGFLRKDASMMPMDAFGNNDTSFLIKSLAPEKQVAQIVDASGSLLGGYAVERVNQGGKEVRRYILVNKEEYEQLANERKAPNKVVVQKLVGCYRNDLERIKQGKRETCQMYFNSQDTHDYFDNLLMG